MYQFFLKPLFDFLGALFLLFLVSPLLLILSAILIYLHRASPFFIQKRIGQHQQVFKIIKFKTMTAQGRTTKFTAFLRQRKLDELPQLLNIIAFQMSFVGPRPDLPGYYDKLGAKYQTITKLKPGLTGYASLYFSNEEEILRLQKEPQAYNDEVIFPQKLDLNLKYVEEMSFLTDLKILLKSAMLPFKG